MDKDQKPTNIVTLAPKSEKQNLVGWLRALADEIEADGADYPIDVVVLSAIAEGGAIWSYKSGNRYDSIAEIGLLRVISLHAEAHTANLVD